MGDLKIDRQKYLKQVNLYAEEKHIYKEFADVLFDILVAASELYAPLAIVQTREKSIASFAEKAARKWSEYQDPVNQITDLCGARIVTSTTFQIKSVCRFIRENFKIDEANSQDTASRLKEDQFGYRSIHYIVQMSKDEIVGIDTKRGEIGKRKAEIQVRTISQHAWPTITHDRLYKASFEVPGHLKRSGHRIAALLEEADIAFDNFETMFESYMGDYAAYMKPEKIQDEIKIMQMVHDVEPDPDKKPLHALHVARLACANKNWEKVIEMTYPYKDYSGPRALELNLVLGKALIYHYLDDPGNQHYIDGIDLLEKAAGMKNQKEEAYIKYYESLCDRKIRAVAASILARVNKDRIQTRDLYSQALSYDPQDPYILSMQLAFSLDHTSSKSVVESAGPAIVKAIETCHAHIKMGLELPGAWLTLARFHLMVSENCLGLCAYSRAIQFYMEEKSQAWEKSELEAELEILQKIRSSQADDSPVFKYAAQLLNLGFWMKTTRDQSIERFAGRERRFKDYQAEDNFLIIAGGAMEKLQDDLEKYYPLIKAALGGFSGIVISGGTTSGIPGLVGKVNARLGTEKTFRTVGYLPYYVHNGVSRCEEYDELVTSEEKDSDGKGEVLEMWLDLMAAGVKPSRIKLLGINGGSISRFEFAIAAAFGCEVGLVQSSGRAADDFLRDELWSDCLNIMPLPDDPMTIMAFAQCSYGRDFSEFDLDQIGQQLHENYLLDHPFNHKKMNTFPWNLLPEMYRESSREQAWFLTWMLRRTGYSIERADDIDETTKILPDDLHKLAEMEHGRWNYESLKKGWRFASKKDEDKKLSPYLIPWINLPDDVKKWDYDAVENFPRILARGGYKVTHTSPDAQKIGIKKPFALSVKAMVRNPEEKFLLIQRSESSKNNPGKWDLPGGKVDPGEDFETALKREIEEETGLEIEITRFAGSAQSVAAGRIIVYIIMEAKTDKINVRLSKEHKNHQWTKRKNLPSVDFAKQFKPFIESFVKEKNGQ